MIAGGGVCNRCNVKGFRFQPTDEELVEHHLNPKILYPDSGDHYIGDIEDLSQFEPSELFRKTQKNPDDKEGYFFLSPTYKNGKKNLISRQGKNGYWGETGRCVTIDSGEEESVIAEKRVFFFFCKGSKNHTAWSFHQLELTSSHPDPIHQDKKKIFLCKLFEKDRRSGSKRKREDNVQETSAKPRRARKDNSLGKKAKVSSNQEAQLDDEHNIMSLEVVHGSQSLPSNPDSSILTRELTPQSHHLPSKDFSSNSMPEGRHHWSTEGLHPSNGSPGDIQIVDDNQQCHHLSSNSTSSISTGVGIPSSTPEEISNIEDPQYNEQRKEESQLSFHLPLDPKNDIICTGLLQQSHHLPSNYKGGSLDGMDEDTNYYQGLNIEELRPLGISLEELQALLGPNYMDMGISLEELRALQPPTTAEVHGCNELPPLTDLSRGAEQLQDQRGSNEEDDASVWASLQPLN